MQAAVVTAFGKAPTCQELPAPVPAGPHEVLVEVVAAGLHPRVRSQANGSHYTSTDELPLVPGIDGVGHTPDGKLRYFVLPDTALGSMAEQTVIDVRRSVELPADVDPIQVAAAMNPLMSSWVALRRRIDFQVGESVLVLGAHGNAGRLAVEVAHHLGAGKVFSGVRATSAEQLREMGASVDVVLDYVWGAPTAEALNAIVPHRVNDNQRLTWVQIGSVAGPECSIPSAALRATRLEIVGSGQGSVDTLDILAELPVLAEEIGRGTFAVNARVVPLADVAQAWRQGALRHRIVVVP